MSLGPGTSALDRNVYLVGFMGCGKTTVAQDLAAASGAPFADLDTEVEERVGLSVMEIFQQHGEPFFRAAELAVLQSISVNRGWVIALGGGTYCNPACKELADASGVAVWLDCPFEEMLLRCRRAHVPRPLAGNETEIRERFQRRLAAYVSAAIRIPSGADRSVRAVTDDILQALRWRGLLT